MKNSIQIFGVANTFCWDLIESAKRLNLNLVCIDNFGAASKDLPNLINLKELKAENLVTSTILGIANPSNRRKALDSAKKLGFSNFANLIDPTSVIATSSEVESGTYVNASVVVASNSHIGTHCVLNRQSSIGHDVELSNFVFIGPGAIVLGNVKIGSGSYVGAGAIIKDGVSIGTNSVIGAGAVVLKDVLDNQTVVGNPAKQIHSK